MQGSLDHLPSRKRAQLAAIVGTIREGFAKAIINRSTPHLKAGKLLKIILFGSHARGGWVDNPARGYHSDYDLLIVVDHDDLTDVAEFWDETEWEILRNMMAAGHKTEVNMIYHSLDEMNENLSFGRYFFVDILRDGIILHDDGGAFVTPGILPKDIAHAEALSYFEDWFESAKRFETMAADNRARQWLKEAAFISHQAAERYYHCFLLVRTLYSPQTHNLSHLRSLTQRLDPNLITVWPTNERRYKRRYELLKDAYVKARYSKHYRITEDELDWIGERLAVLRDVVEKGCREWLAGLKQ
jgi:uncharacterized protein